MSEPAKAELGKTLPNEPVKEFLYEWRWIGVSGLLLVAIGLFGPGLAPKLPTGLFVFIERIGEACIIAMLVGRLIDFPARLYTTRTLAADISKELDEARRQIFGILHNEAIVKRVLDITQQERVLRRYIVEYSFKHLPDTKQVRVTVEYTYTPINLTSRTQTIYPGEVLDLHEHSTVEMDSMSVWKGDQCLFSYDKNHDKIVPFRVNAKKFCIEWRVDKGIELPPLNDSGGEMFRVRYKLVKMMKEVDKDFVMSFRTIEDPRIEVRERDELRVWMGDTPRLKGHNPVLPISTTFATGP